MVALVDDVKDLMEKLMGEKVFNFVYSNLGKVRNIFQFLKSLKCHILYYYITS